MSLWRVESFMSSEFGWEGRTHSLDVRVSPSRDDLVARPAFAYLNPDIADSCVVAHIRALGAQVGPDMDFDLLPSSQRGQCCSDSTLMKKGMNCVHKAPSYV